MFGYYDDLSCYLYDNYSSGLPPVLEDILYPWLRAARERCKWAQFQREMDTYGDDELEGDNQESD